MPQINVQVNAIAFYDNAPSNNPLLRAFDLTVKAFGISTTNPDQRSYILAPDEEKVIYDGTRTTLVTNSTAFNVTRPDLTKDTYRFTGNTASAFRTERATGADTSTSLTISVNGPVSTFTVSAGTFNTSSIQVGDILKIEAGAGCSASNQGRFSIIGKTSTSISIKNLNAAGETFTITDASKFMIYSNGGGISNQIQINDTVILSSGFSPATQGSYQVIEVTPTWFEVDIGASNGIPLETGIVPTTSGLIFYSSAKKFVLITSQDKISVKFNTDSTDNTIVEAVEANNPEKPGILLKNGMFYKLTVKNLGLNPTSIIVASGD
jgi:hypothetical protein